MYHSTASNTLSMSNRCTFLLKLSTIKPTFKTVLPDPATLFWHLPRIYCGGMAHRTGPVPLCNQGYGNLSWYLWFFVDTDDRWIPTIWGKQFRKQNIKNNSLVRGREHLISSLWQLAVLILEQSHLTSLNRDCFNITSSVAVNKHFHRLVLPM